MYPPDGNDFEMTVPPFRVLHDTDPDRPIPDGKVSVVPKVGDDDPKVCDPVTVTATGAWFTMNVAPL